LVEKNHRKESQAVRPANDPGRIIPLTKGEFAVVSEIDYARVSQWSWQYQSDSNPYAKRTSTSPDGARHSVYLHRFVMNAPAGLIVNHNNGDTLDCRRGNLKLVSSLENSTLYKVRRGRYGYHGVNHRKPYAEPGKKNFQARAHLNGVRVSLGSYTTPDEAARAYDYFMVEHYDIHAPTNFPLSDYICPVHIQAPSLSEDIPF